MTGEHFKISGTIKSIFKSAFDAELKTKNTGILLADAIGEDNIQELALFFIGEREETHRDFINTSQSRDVTVEEIEEYLKTLYVNEDFEYSNTIESF